METEQDRLAIMRWETETGPTAGKNKRPGARATAKIVAEPVKLVGKPGISQRNLQKIPVVGAKPAGSATASIQSATPARGIAKPVSANKQPMQAPPGIVNSARAPIAVGRTSLKATGIAKKEAGPAKSAIPVAKANMALAKRAQGSLRKSPA